MKGRRFTGGDKLEGFPKYLHQVMMLNELGGGTGGYELADAKIGKSGYSFGGNQMDLTGSPAARDVLRDILLVNKMSKEQIEGYLEMFKKNGRFKHFSTNREVSLLNAALGSVEGVKIIDNVYVKEINANIGHIDKILKNVHPGLKPFVNDPVVKLILADYHNQFHLSENGKMHSLLQGKSVMLASKVTLDIAAIKSPDDLVKELRRAIYATGWGSKEEGKRDIMRRQHNIDKVAAEFIAPERDKKIEPVPQHGQEQHKQQPHEPGKHTLNKAHQEGSVVSALRQQFNALMDEISKSISPAIKNDPVVKDILTHLDLAQARSVNVTPDKQEQKVNSSADEPVGIHARRIQIMNKHGDKEAETEKNSSGEVAPVEKDQCIETQETTRRFVA